MSPLSRSVLPLALAASLVAGSARADVVYKWIITNNFQLNGQPVLQLDPSVCSGMSCPVLSSNSVGYGGSVTATATVPPTTTGSSPSATVYLGFAWPNGTNRNECGFTIAGGTVNGDGTSTAPTAYPFIWKYTLAGYRVQPGCKISQPKVTSQCDTSGKNCTYTSFFSIETYN